MRASGKCALSFALPTTSPIPETRECAARGPTATSINHHIQFRARGLHRPYIATRLLFLITFCNTQLSTEAHSLLFDSYNLLARVAAVGVRAARQLIAAQLTG